MFEGIEDLEDARAAIQVELGPVLVMCRALDGSPDDSWNYEIPWVASRMAIAARSRLVSQEPKQAAPSETEFHRAETILSSIAALALLLTHDLAQCEGGELPQPELYRASRDEVRADLIALCSLASELWSDPVEEPAAA